MTLVWRARAINDLRNLFAHIARYTDPGHAYDVLAELRTQIEALLDQPTLGRRGHQRGTRYLLTDVASPAFSQVRPPVRAAGRRAANARRIARRAGVST